jgi:hypothetical protein
VVSFWSEKSRSTTDWATPRTLRLRTQGHSTGHRRISAALADPGGSTSGLVKGSTATTNTTRHGDLGVNWTIVLRPRHRAAAPTSISAPTTTGAHLLDLNLTGIPNGPISPANFARALPGATGATASYARTSVGTDSTGRFLRESLRAGTYGPGNGIVVGIPLPRAVNEATIRYSLRFPANFDWSMGGKLPGLSGVAPGTSWTLPAGGQRDPNNAGWSGRLMWLGKRAYAHVGAKPNEISSYVYHPGQADAYGDNEWWNKAAPAGTKFAVTQHVVMNTPGRANGVLEAWLGNVKVIDRHDYVFRTRTDVKINWLMWSIFRGGNDSRWAGSRDGYVDLYDDLRVTTP